ncbi:hypothetical protein EHM76_00670 [bacterium]|nr:MAG: hypothetical protein EHM76_00670 [bacterium]
MFAIVVLIILFVLSTLLHFCYLGPLARAKTRAKYETSLNAVFMEKLRESIGSAEKVRTPEMIKLFLQDFNENKAGWAVTDEQLEIEIKRHIGPWPIFRKLQFKWLIDDYKKEEKKRKARSQVLP